MISYCQLGPHKKLKPYGIGPAKFAKGEFDHEDMMNRNVQMAFLANKV